MSSSTTKLYLPKNPLSIVSKNFTNSDDVRLLSEFSESGKSFVCILWLSPIQKCSRRLVDKKPRIFYF
uniref:Uncharacterized protein n=1 Tax=Romanomermis culicivorax TaxID=13658 RepID=A0A915IG59_ROMCU